MATSRASLDSENWYHSIFVHTSTAGTHVGGGAHVTTTDPRTGGDTTYTFWHSAHRGAGGGGRTGWNDYGASARGGAGGRSAESSRYSSSRDTEREGSAPDPSGNPLMDWLAEQQSQPDPDDRIPGVPNPHDNYDPPAHELDGYDDFIQSQASNLPNHNQQSQQGQQSRGRTDGPSGGGGGKKDLEDDEFHLK